MKWTTIIVSIVVLAAPASARADVDTFIEGGPAGATRDTTPSFTFGSTAVGAPFKCMIDGPRSPRPALSGCHSPYTAPKLPSGAFTFVVQAQAAGAADGTPATRAFVVDADPPDTAITGGPPEGGRTDQRSPRF